MGADRRDRGIERAKTRKQEQDDGNRTQAARVLGLSVRTLRYKIRVYIAVGIEVPAHHC